MKIGLFDSGVGGLNVLKEILKKYPNNTYYYYGDNKNVPYGDKDKETLLSISTNIIRFFERMKVDIIIIACGTISSTCYDELKKLTSIPIFDIITPTIEYVNSLNLKSFLVLGTKRTIESHIFKNRLTKNVKEVATPEFVFMIENFQIDSGIIKKYLMKEKMDCLVLGCTHYPLLIPEFKKYLKGNPIIIDMGVCLANKIKIKNDGNQEIHLFFTKMDDLLKKNIATILKEDYYLHKI